MFCFFLFLVTTDENNVIQEFANNHNNNMEADEMTCERQSEIHRNSSPMNHAMIWINDQPSTDYANERTISSSSSEQLIPKEKQTGKETKHATEDILHSTH